MDSRIIHLFSSASIAFGLFLTCACSDSGSNTDDVAGGVTDIGNSIANAKISGTVLNASGKAIASARVVAYYDSWNQTKATDSVEVVTDENGSFTLEVDSTANLVLYAENGNECGLAFASDTNKLVLGNRKSLKSSVSGETGGYMRIVGTNETAKVHEDGTFSFDAIPPGDISLVYVRDEKPQGYLEFKTTDTRDQIHLPPLENRRDDGHFDAPDFEDDMFGVDFGRHWDYYDSAVLNISLHMEGYEPVFNSDHSWVKDTDFVEGISGAARFLKAGQYISLERLPALGLDFSVSLWTKWDGPSKNNQVLLGEKVDSDSTPQFTWYFDNEKNSLAIKGKTKQGDQTMFFDTSTLQSGKWTFLVLVSHNSEITLYINGEAVQASDGSATKMPLANTRGSATYYIGGTGDGTSTWNGALDEYHVEGFAQSAEWVKSVYENSGKISKKYPRK